MDLGAREPVVQIVAAAHHTYYDEIRVAVLLRYLYIPNSYPKVFNLNHTTTYSNTFFLCTNGYQVARRERFGVR